jgi:hypothetical protein
MQPPGPQYPYPQQQQPMYPPQQQGYPQAPMMQQAPAKKRNVGLIVVGCILLAIGGLAFLVFAYNAYQYSTVEEHFSDIQGSAWVVDLIKASDMRRMTIFGPVAAVFGIAGLVLGILGMRKK